MAFIKKKIRCYIKMEEENWVAVCIDFNLAAQADTPQEAKEKLDAMINSYIGDLMNQDKVYAVDLLNRKAPLSLLFEYYVIAAMYNFHMAKNKYKTFVRDTNDIPYKPA